MITDKELLEGLLRRYNIFISENGTETALEEYRKDSYICNLDVFQSRLARYERFMLPEMILLFCIKEEWWNEDLKSKYKPLRELFTLPVDKIHYGTISNLLKPANNILVSTLDEFFLKKMNQVLSREEEKLDAEIEVEEHQKQELEKALIPEQVENTTSKDQVSEAENNNTDAKLTVKTDFSSRSIKNTGKLLEEVKKKLTAAINKKKKYQNNRQRVEELYSCTGDNIKIARQDVLFYLPVAETALFEIRTRTALSNKTKNYFSSGDVKDFINLIRSEDDVIGILVSLYREGLINLDLNEIGLESNPFVNLLVAKSDKFEKYMVANFPISLDAIRADLYYKNLFDMAFHIDMNMIAKDAISLNFTELWNCIEDPLIWEWMLNEIKNAFSDNWEYYVVPFVYKIQGRTSRAFLNALEKQGCSLAHMIKQLMDSRNIEVNRELVVQLSNRLEKTGNTLQRNFIRASKKNDEQAGRIFAALNEPIARLEELAISIKSAPVILDNNVISNQLIDIVAGIRNGLCEVEVYPVEEIVNWANQISVNYDKYIHRYEKGENREGTLITLNTLGFRYKENSEEIIEPARAIACNNIQGESDGV